MPSAQDLFSEKTGPWVEKLLAAQCDASTIDRMRVMRLVENLTLGAAAVGYRTESMHGAGSPQAQRIMIARQSNMEHKKQLARELAGVGTSTDAQKAKLRKPAAVS
jgi:4-hydroxybutyryl-CoA dehydratase/vinylacetyl-CoA-Delta-isomerase